MRPIRVCMLVRNPCTRDVRVLKEAKTLSHQGFDVTIVAVNPRRDLPEREERDGFQIIRVEVNPLSVRLLRRLTAILSVRRAARRAYRRLRRFIILSVGKARRGYRRLRRLSRRAYRAVRRASRRLASRLLSAVKRQLTSFAHNAVMLFHDPLALLDYGLRCRQIIAKQPAHIYHAHDFNTLPVGYYLSRRYKGKLVYDSHELNLEAGRMARVKGLRKRLLRAQERFLIRRCDGVITVNDSIAGILEKQYRVPRPTVVMNCPERADGRSGDGLQAMANVSSDSRIVLYHGNLAANRGLHQLIEASQWFEGAVLVLMGAGGLKEELSQLAETLGVSYKVRFVDPVPVEKVIEIVSSADLGVIPVQSTVDSYYYALPNKFFDCLMAGVPVAASNFPEMEAIISKHAIGVTFDPTNAQDIARAVNQALTSADLASMKQRAREVAHGRYCWEVESEQLLALYKALGDNKGLRLTMLVRNPCTHDVRVLKEAKTLSRQGFDVTIIAVNPRRDLPEREERDGFQIIRVEVNPLSVRSYRAVRKAFRAMRTGAALVVRLIARLLGASAEAEGLPVEEQSRLLRLAKRLSEVSSAVFHGLAVPFVLVAHLLRTIGHSLTGAMVAALGWGRRLASRLLDALERRLIGLVRSAVVSFHGPLSLLDYGLRCRQMIGEQPADLYHAHDLNTLPVGYYLSRRYKGKLVYDSHELHLETGRAAELRGLRKRLLRAYEGFLIRRCDGAITASDLAARLLASQYGISRPVALMNCPEADELASDGDPLREALDLPLNAKVVLYQGGFLRGRALEQLIEASSHFADDAYLVFMGAGTLESTLKALAENSPVRDRIKFKEAVPVTEVLRYVACADVGVVPLQATTLNNELALPNKLFDYLMAGVPVAVSDFPELGRIVRKHRVGTFFNPEDPQDMARAINSVLSHPNYETMANNAKAIAMTQYSWPLQESKLIDLYRRLAN